MPENNGNGPAEIVNKWGFSKKTNIAIAGITGIATAKDSIHAVVAISIIVIVALSYQFLIDKMKEKKIAQ